MDKYDLWKTTEPEPKTSQFKCICCGDELYPYEEYYDIEAEPYCERCAEKWFKEQRRTVSEEQCYGGF